MAEQHCSQIVEQHCSGWSNAVWGGGGGERLGGGGGGVCFKPRLLGIADSTHHEQKLHHLQNFHHGTYP